MRLGGGDGSLSCGLMAFWKEVMDRRAAEKAKKKCGKDPATSVTASPVSARDHGPSEDIDDIFKGCGYTDVSESVSCGIVPLRDGSFGSINKAKGRGLMEEYTNTVHEQPPISADIEHFFHTISVLTVLFGIVVFHIIGYAMGANAIHSTVANVPKGPLLIGRMLTLKHNPNPNPNRMLSTNLDVNAGDTMGTLTPNNLTKGTAFPAPMFCSVLFRPPPPPPPSMQQ